MNKKRDDLLIVDAGFAEPRESLSL